MASFTMTASFLGGSTTVAAATRQPSTMTSRRGVVMAKAATTKMTGVEKTNDTKEGSNGRRDLVFAAAAAAAWSVARMALADEPGRGTPDAKKKYAPVCVTMPTARICHK